MALSQTQVSQLYVSVFGRSSEGAGNIYWQGKGSTLASVCDQMLDTDNAKTYFGTAIDANQSFVEHIYFNTLGKAPGTDVKGVAYWTARLDAGEARGVMVESMVGELVNGDFTGNQAALDSQAQFYNRVDVSNYTAITVGTADVNNLAPFSTINSSVTNDPATVAPAKTAAYSMRATDVFNLTSGTDIGTSNQFNAPMVYTPDGSDRILSLQDEDQLTGIAGLTTNTLNAVMGNMHTDQGLTAIVTPVLNNIQRINIDWTGNTTTLDLRYSDSVKTINIEKITADANAVILNNITTIASDIKVQNVYDNTSSQTFTYVRGVLAGADDTMTLELAKVLSGTLIVQSGAPVLNEGYEKVNMKVSGGVDYNAAVTINDMENLTVTGSGLLEILGHVWTANEFNAFTNALTNGAAGVSIGQRTIDLSAFTGTSNIDISINVGRNVDPGNSGAAFYGVTTGGTGDDTFHTNATMAVAAAFRTDTVHNMIDGGTGANKLVMYAGGIDDGSTTSANSNLAEIKNIQGLELRAQAALTTVDMDAFDTTLTSVFMRGEQAGVTTFDLDDVSVALAADGLKLAHGITGAGNPMVQVELKDGTGASDTVALSLVNDLNTGTTFDFTLQADGFDTDGLAGTANTGIAATSDADAIENITIHDTDTESNIVTLTNIINHTGTTTLDGGTAAKTFTVFGTLNSATVDASAQLSNMRLTVGDTVGAITTITQAVKLGVGDDILTYANIDELDATDTLTDAGGTDTVRAAFSKDSTLDITGIENLHVTSTANVTLGMSKAVVTSFVLLADSATGGVLAVGDVDNNGQTDMNIAGSSLPASIVTLDKSTLTQLNFFGDADTDNSAATDETRTHTFNGVTLTNNTATAITANINSSLDLNATTAVATSGNTAYTIGQITSHGNTSMDILVANERAVAFGSAVTTINNIYAKTMTSLTATATGALTLGTVSGAPLNNSLKTFDMSKVGGVVTANIISLGNAGVVTLGNANHVVSALGSAGKNVVMTAGNGNNTLTGTAQSDTITTGSGWDTILGDRGDNVITAGAGNDTVTAKDGNDTVDLGTGIDTFTDNVDTGIVASLATNTVSMSGGISTTWIDVLGDDTATGVADNVNQMLAVGAGSDLTVSWLGAGLNAAAAVLDGGLASVDVMVSTPGSDLVVQTAAGIDVFNGAAGNDVYIATNSDVGAAGTGDVAVQFTGGAGNDAAVGSDGADIFNGGTGADKYAMQNSSVVDLDSDVVFITDGDSLAASYDQVSGFDVTAVASVVSGGVAVVSGAGGTAGTVGSDYLDLDNAFATGNLNAGVATADLGTVDGNTALAANLNAAGLVSFINSNNLGGAADVVGTGTGQISLANALAYLATNTVAGATYVFQYDANGDGAMTAADSSFVFQDGVSDTVVELLGVNAVGAQAVTGAVLNTIGIG